MSFNINSNNKSIASINGISLYYAGEIAIIVMDRGENRINHEFVTGMSEILDIVESNQSLKGLITTGKGKFYGNGLDLNGFAKMPHPEVAVVMLKFQHLLKRILMFPIPTLAAVNGHAFAGGALIAYVHDLRTMQTDRGWICMNEVFLNLQVGTFLMKLLESKIGKGPVCCDALVLGKRFTAAEAFNVGMVHSIQPSNLLLNESIQVLKSFYGKGYLRESLLAMKQDVYKDALDLYEELKVEKQLEDAKIGIMPVKAQL